MMVDGTIYTLDVCAVLLVCSLLHCVCYPTQIVICLVRKEAPHTDDEGNDDGNDNDNKVKSAIHTSRAKLNGL